MSTPEKLTVEIELGNEAMQDAGDIAAKLREVAGWIEMGETDGPIKDLNGNAVGFYNIV